MPEDIEPRVQELVKRAARKLAISGTIVARYAKIVIAAEEVLRMREESEKSTRDRVVGVAALEHGIYESDPEKARLAYFAARNAQWELHNSARGLAKRVAKFEEKLVPRHASLQVDVASKYPLSRLVAASECLRKLFAEA